MNLQRVSKALSYLLRHCQEPLYIDLNGGWADIDEIASALQKKYRGFNRELLARIVATDEKGRYFYDLGGGRIRANQGHSISGVVIEMEEPEPPELLYHGTAERFLPSILSEGLLPMGRQFVHLSSDIPTALKVGSRHGTPAVLAVEAGRFVADGHTLKRSENGVWQAQAVPAGYLHVLTDLRSDGNGTR
ncbi:MAG: RNA 2'-phosphotransferase [Candidatus Onthomonas sp.]